MIYKQPKNSQSQQFNTFTQNYTIKSRFRRIGEKRKKTKSQSRNSD